MDVSPIIEAQDLGFAYEENSPVLRELSFSMNAGERVGLVGANGSGKSTFLRLLVGLLKTSTGTLNLFGAPRFSEESFVEVRKRAGLVFQNPDDQLFCPTVLDDVAFGPLNLGENAESARRIALETLGQVGLHGFEERITHKLSGGEKQLVALASVLAMKPEVLLLDEPVAGLDAKANLRVRSALEQLPQSMIIISHDETLIETLSTRRVFLRDGRIEN
ncbi:MAG: energy-coupling factor ABC transporter ATP-binding protein [Planctomycetes bacterium]|nr:energy-coupling factor ABC transporter ATP-binding protein [Planctomycetota bacterium]